MYIGKLWQRLSVYERWMWVCVVLAMLLRLLLILFHWPATNSDEGNMGMVALNVAYHGDHPVFFYGLPYMGPVEGYVAVPFFYLFGPSVTTLRLGLLIFLFGFLVGTFYLVRLLFNEKYALAAVILLGLGSPDLFLLQLRAVGEYPEMLMFGTCIPLCALWLSLTVPRVSEVAVMGYQRRRLLVYLLLGAMMGVAVWIDFLIGPFFVMALLMLWAFCRNEVKSRYGLTGLLGFLIGVFPLIYYNVTAPINRNSLNVLLDI
jgi:4-amino-4-deoxy-L-arabinose transferase-like glycosyltransferase